MKYFGEKIDVSKQFSEIGNTYFNVSKMTDFDSETKTGLLLFDTYHRKSRISFNEIAMPFEKSQLWTFPPVYEDYKVCPMSFSFSSPDTVRVRCTFSENSSKKESLMLENLTEYNDVTVETTELGVVMKTSKMQVEVVFWPFSIIFKDDKGKLLTKTLNLSDSKCLMNFNPLPLSYVRRNDNFKKYSATSFLINPEEHFFGGGESFTKLDKTGQKLVLYTQDALGVQTRNMYKPIPFYMSSRGYGIFAHTSTPVTLDLGYTYQEAQTIFAGEDIIDFFFFTGAPKEILTSYTSLTGRAKTPPLWSFGLWMSRITYKSENEVYDVAKKLKEHEIPCDVIHLDTGWFEKDWCCDFRFSEERFDDPQKMIDKLKEDGIHISLWQIPYFTPINPLYHEVIEKKLVILDPDGKLPTNDAILDFSNPQAVEWYQNKLRYLLEMGVDAIKADFGEAAPVTSIYHSGQSGMVEHNLYPLRYNKVVASITKEMTDNTIIWARSAWAGSQRYPIHWGGDAENTNMSMLSSLRGGLSLGMCGFSFWSHDSGGFVKTSPEELYGRWNFMTIFTSHMRCHGQPPKEPWEYSEMFLDLFRKQMKLRYELIPYVFAQSINSATKGHPLLRSMFLEFSKDPNCIPLEDQYMFGEDILVAPLFHDNINSRSVYLPKGEWVDLVSKEVYQGQQWHNISGEELKGIALVRGGAVIPMVKLALNTSKIDWSTIKYHWYSTAEKKITGTGLDTISMTPFGITDEFRLKFEK